MVAEIVGWTVMVAVSCGEEVIVGSEDGCTVGVDSMTGGIEVAGEQEARNMKRNEANILIIWV
jgi:hypothetical protein